MAKPYDVFGVEFKGKGGTAMLKGRWDPDKMMLDIGDAHLVGEIRRARGGEKEATLKIGKTTYAVISAKPMPASSAHVARILAKPMDAEAPGQSNAADRMVASADRSGLGALASLKEAVTFARSVKRS